jgi:replicative DNA helicase
MNPEEINKRQNLLETEMLNHLLVYPHNSIKVSQLISAEDFHSHGKAFAIVLKSYTEEKNVVDELIAAKVQVADFFEKTSIRSTESIARDLKEVSNARKIFALLEGFLKKVPHEGTESFVSDIQSSLIRSVSKREVEDSSISSVIEDYKKQQEIYVEKFVNGTGIIGLPTGYEKLDNIIDGLRPEHLWIIGGYTNMGKSFASLNIMANLIKQGKRVVFYSIEMSKIDILCRLLGILTNQNGLSILKGFAKDYASVEKALELLKASNSAIYSGKAELSEIQMSMLEENLRNPADLFIVDFIQIMTVKGSRTEYETITTCSLELQQSAKRLKKPIIALSQVSNDGARNADQDVMTFKGSGAIAAAADLAIEITYDDADSKEERLRKIRENEPINMKWKIRKNRHGSTGYLEMKFTGKTGRFEPTDILEQYK